MPIDTARDTDATCATLARWLEPRLPGDGPVLVADLVLPPGNGFSSETILFTATRTGGPAGAGARTASGAGSPVTRQLVAQVAPTTHTLFLDADVRQFPVMEALSSESRVRVPHIIAREDDPAVLGAPFIVMDRIEGLVPPDNLPYTMDGWLLEATPADQERAWWSGIEQLAEITRVDWESIGLSFLGKESASRQGRPGLEEKFSYAEAHYEWSRRGQPQPVSEAVLAWLKEHRPADDGPTVFSWGDSRLGNMLFDDYQCAGVLDWEMACVGPPELDLAWWIWFDRLFSEGLGVPRIPGFPGYDETIARWSELTGHTPRHLEWFQVFAGFQFATVLCRLAQLMAGTDVLTMGSDFETNNLATQFLAKMLDIPT